MPFWGILFYISCLFCISRGTPYIHPIFPRSSPRASGFSETPPISPYKAGDLFTPIYKYKLVQAFEKPTQARYSLLYKSIPVYQTFSRCRLISPLFWIPPPPVPQALRCCRPAHTLVYRPADSQATHKFC